LPEKFAVRRFAFVAQKARDSDPSLDIGRVRSDEILFQSYCEASGMRLLSIRLTVALIAGITLVSLSFSYYEALGEKRGLRRDLERRAEVLGQSLAGSVERHSEEDSLPDLSRIVQDVGSRQ
jgi:hypothetical protein